jgi:hypothetical protein
MANDPFITKKIFDQDWDSSDSEDAPGGEELKEKCKKMGEVLK